MAITWTKEWAGVDDGTLLKAVDLRNIQTDLANVLQSSDLHMKTVTFTRNTADASGTQAVTGVGFTPKAVVFLSLQIGSDEMSIGIDDGVTAYAMYDDTPTSANTYGGTATSSIHGIETVGNTYVGKVTAFGADGCTITWTKTGTPTGTLTVYALFLG